MAFKSDEIVRVWLVGCIYKDGKVIGYKVYFQGENRVREYTPWAMTVLVSRINTHNTTSPGYKGLNFNYLNDAMDLLTGDADLRVRSDMATFSKGLLYGVYPISSCKIWEGTVEEAAYTSKEKNNMLNIDDHGKLMYGLNFYEYVDNECCHRGMNFVFVVDAEYNSATLLFKYTILDKDLMLRHVTDDELWDLIDSPDCIVMFASKTKSKGRGKPILFNVVMPNAGDVTLYYPASDEETKSKGIMSAVPCVTIEAEDSIPDTAVFEDYKATLVKDCLFGIRDIVNRDTDYFDGHLVSVTSSDTEGWYLFYDVHNDIYISPNVSTGGTTTYGVFLRMNKINIVMGTRHEAKDTALADHIRIPSPGDVAGMYTLIAVYYYKGVPAFCKFKRLQHQYSSKCAINMGDELIAKIGKSDKELEWLKRYIRPIEHAVSHATYILEDK